MKEISKTLTKILFYLVAAILMLWTASLTVEFVQSALPNSAWYVPYLALVVFDGGMIAWLFVFLRYAEGTIQRATALGLTFFNFLGVGLLVMADILLGGQEWAAAPESLGVWAVWGIGIWTIVNVLGVLVFHIGDPEAQYLMTLQNELDAVQKDALMYVAEKRAENSKRLAADIGDGMYKQLLHDLGIDQDGDGIPDFLQPEQTIGSDTVIFPAQIPPIKGDKNNDAELFKLHYFKHYNWHELNQVFTDEKIACKEAKTLRDTSDHPVKVVSNLRDEVVIYEGTRGVGRTRRVPPNGRSDSEVDIESNPLP